MKLNEHFRNLCVLILLLSQIEIAQARGISASTEEVKISYTSSGYPLIECSFGNHTIKKGCLLDTGSDITILPPEISHRNSEFRFVRPDGNSNWVGDSSRDCDIRDVEQFRIGPLDSAVSEVTRCDKSAAPFGIVGIFALGNDLWKFDLEKNTLGRESSFPAGVDKIQFTLDSSNHIVMPILAGSISVKAIFDTGSPDVYIDSELYKNNRNLFKFIGRDSFHGQVTGIYSTKGLSVGGLTLTPRNVIILDFEKNSVFKSIKAKGVSVLLGSSAIRNHPWHIDFGQQLWAVE